MSMFRSSTLLLAVTGLTAALALPGLAQTGSPASARPTVPAAEVVAEAALPSAGPAPSVAADAPDLPTPLEALLRRQAAAGLDCFLTPAQVPMCAHGNDPEPVPHHQDGSGAAGTAHGTAGSTTGSTGTIGCYGDGTGGPRVRAVYARPQSAPDRYGSSLSSIRGWAAGISKHFDTSAVRTKGRRHVRFATTAGGACSVTVLNVALPDSAFSSFSATVSALQARGLDQAGSKYLVWADATGYCGVATTYADDSPGLDNLNNGRFPSYARVDRRCWGKVETHEVVHMLGGVQRSARNSTDGGHCSDGRDLMCYADGTARSTQRAVCAPDSAELLDCRNDDYFSTAAPRGSYLQTHWNTARSSFLAATVTEAARVTSTPRPAPGPSASRVPSPVASAAPSARPTATPSSAGGGLLPALPIPLPTLAPLPLATRTAR